MLYHCVLGDKIMLVYKDNQDVLHCYEVEERDLVEKVRRCADRGMVNEILVGYAAKAEGTHINKSGRQTGNEQVLSGSDGQTDAEQVLSEFKARSPCGEQVAGGDGCAQDEQRVAGAAAPEVGQGPSVQQDGAGAGQPEAAGSQDGAGAGAGQPEAAGSQDGAGAGQPKGPESEGSKPEAEKERSNIVFIGQKSTMDYVQATLTRLSNYHSVTITARGKRITLAVDVSQMIVKRMNKVGYRISEVKIGSDAMEVEDGKTRNVSTIEINIVDGMESTGAEAGDGQQGDAENP